MRVSVNRESSNGPIGPALKWTSGISTRSATEDSPEGASPMALTLGSHGRQTVGFGLQFRLFPRSGERGYEVK